VSTGVRNMWGHRGYLCCSGGLHVPSALTYTLFLDTKYCTISGGEEQMTTPSPEDTVVLRPTDGEGELLLILIESLVTQLEVKVEAIESAKIPALEKNIKGRNVLPNAATHKGALPSGVSMKWEDHNKRSYHKQVEAREKNDQD